MGSPTRSGTVNGVTFPDDNKNGLPGFAWGMLALPYLERDPVYNAFNTNLACWGGEDTTGARVKLATFLCPSATGGSDGFAVHRYSNGDAAAPNDAGAFNPEIRFAHSHHITNAGINQPWSRPPAYSSDFDIAEPIAPGVSLVIDGPFYRDGRVTVAAITDGLSNTVFLGEGSSRLCDKTWVGVVPFGCTPPKPGWPSDPNSGGNLVAAHSGPDIRDHPQVVIHAPNHPFGHTDEIYAEHPGGANVLMGDGSVRFIGASIDPYTRVALSTRNRGEIVPGDFRTAMPPTRRTRPARRAILALGLAALLAAVPGCGRPPSMGPDRDVFRAVDALHAAVSLRDPMMVARCDADLKKLKADGKLPDAAARSLDALVARTAKGEWEPAIDDLNAFMEGQRR